ncbi:hypothetical protein D3C85_475850 [compost metagenome]
MVAQALVAARVEFAAVELLPEFLVLGAAGILGFAEHAVVLALDIAQVVVHDGEEIIVGFQHIALHVEFDHGLRLADGADLAFVFDIALFQGRDVGSELDDFIRLAVRVEDGVVGSVDPHFAPIPGAALVFALVEFAASQLGPEVAVFVRFDILGVAEDRMVLALHLGQAIADDTQEILVRMQDGAVEFEFDDGLDTVQCSIYRL